MVFLDEKDQKIQAFIKKSLVLKYSTQLEEGKCYLIQNFVLSQNSGEYKTTCHPFKIIFQYSTAVKEVDLPNIAPNSFSFHSFEDIMSMKLDETFLVDVIGEVTQIGEVEVTDINGKKSKRVNLMLEDNRKCWITVTLWDEYCDKVSSYVTLSRVPIVMILQYAKIRRWKGVVYLSNCMYCTNIMLDADIPPVNEFKKCLRESGDRTPTISLLTSYNTSGGHDDFLQASEKRTIDEIREINEAGVFVVLATIVSIETRFSWFYNSCKCRKKVIEQGSKFWCGKCEKEVQMVIPRYKVQVRVMDDTSSASFVIFDREMIQVLGKTAAELRTEQAKDGDMDCFPDDLQKLVNKKFLFRIKINNHNLLEGCSSFPVMKMTENGKIIEAFSGNKENDDNTQESIGDGGDMDAIELKTPTCSKNKEFVDAELSTNGVPIKKIKIEKEDNPIAIVD